MERGKVIPGIAIGDFVTAETRNRNLGSVAKGRANLISHNDELVSGIIYQINTDRKYNLSNFSLENSTDVVTIKNIDLEKRLVGVQSLNKKKQLGFRHFCLSANLVTRSSNNPLNLISNQDMINWYQ